MPVLAECPTCGKTYQAPDAMLGKMVRCKQCQNVFRIGEPVNAGGGGNGGEPDGTNVDFDALAQSFGGEEADGAAMGGPTVDEHGRASIRRRADVSDLGIRGDAAGTGRRANLRYRYPFARQIDVGLPWLIVVLAIAVPLRLSLTTGGRIDETVTGGVGFSRFLALFLCTAILTFPLIHLAMSRAAEELRFNLPRAPLWRSFACACSVLLLGGSLYILSGGAMIGLILGLLVGVATCGALVTLLFRVLPHEVGKTVTYAAVASGVGALATAIVIGGLNFIGMKVTAAQAEPTLFTSPFAVGLPWIEKPAPPAALPPKPVRPTVASPVAPSLTPSVPGATPPPTPAVVAADPTPAEPTAPAVSALQALPLPPAGANGIQFVKSLELTPVGVGFDELLFPLVESRAMGVLRRGGGGSVECWDTGSWVFPGSRIATSFDRAQGPLTINTDRDRVVRITSVPSWRIDSIPIGNAAPTAPIRLEGPNGGERQLEGFLNDHDLIVRKRLDQGTALAFEVYDLRNAGAAADEAKPMEVDAPPAADGTPQPRRRFQVGKGERAVRWLPDGSGVILAGYDADPSRQPVLAFYRYGDTERPTSVRRIDWAANTRFEPVGLAANAAGRAALLLEAGGEGYLTLWQMRDRVIDGAPQTASDQPIMPRVGLIGQAMSVRWSGLADPLCWIDDDTLLLYGQRLYDANTGRLLGTINVANVSNVTRLENGRLLVTLYENGINSLVVLTIDPAALAKARQTP